MLCVKQGKCFKTNSLLKYETLEREEVGETIKLKYQTPQNTLVKKIASLDLDVPSSDQLKLGTDICNVPFNFYLILILASFLPSSASTSTKSLAEVSLILGIIFPPTPTT